MIVDRYSKEKTEINEKKKRKSGSESKLTDVKRLLRRRHPHDLRAESPSGNATRTRMLCDRIPQYVYVCVWVLVCLCVVGRKIY